VRGPLRGPDRHDHAHARPGRWSKNGDVVNTAARLASAAAAGEILVSREAAQTAGLELGPLEHRSLELKGKSVPTEVVVLTTVS
jgi:class 3 adenylate cyclase